LAKPQKKNRGSIMGWGLPVRGIKKVLKGQIALNHFADGGLIDP